MLPQAGVFQNSTGVWSKINRSRCATIEVIRTQGRKNETSTDMSSYRVGKYNPESRPIEFISGNGEKIFSSSVRQ